MYGGPGVPEFRSSRGSGVAGVPGVPEFRSSRGSRGSGVAGVPMEFHRHFLRKYRFHTLLSGHSPGRSSSFVLIALVRTDAGLSER